MTEVTASAAELQTVLGPLGAKAEFIVSQVRLGATIEVALVRWAGCLAAELKDAKAEIETLQKASHATTVRGSKGYSPLPDLPEGSGTRSRSTGQALAEGSAADEWNASVTALMEEKRCSRAVAVQKLVRTNPELHAAYVEGANIGRA